MTEKDLDNLQKDIYWWLSQKMRGIPPILQKIIMEGIYSRFQSKAESYDWELQIQEKSNSQGVDNNLNEQDKKVES